MNGTETNPPLPLPPPPLLTALPDRDSPDLCLDHPTPAERTHIWEHYAALWGKALPRSQYLEECRFMDEAPLVRLGGMTYWILVDKHAHPDQRVILSFCRTIRKHALVSESVGIGAGVEAETGTAGARLHDVWVHGVAGVFCEPQYRRRGYASRMMTELARVLRTWQSTDSIPCAGSILYSDVGTQFYSRFGWLSARSNMHIEFPAERHPHEPGVVALRAGDVEALCTADELAMRDDLSRQTDRTRLAIIPDHAHMGWHHAKEDFTFSRIFGEKPELKGVVVGVRPKRVWAIWSHRLYTPPGTAEAAGNTLYILRLVIENARTAVSSEDQMEIKAKLEATIHAAQTEAAGWQLSRVKIWNPSPLAEKLIEWTGMRCERVERKETYVASLLWYGEGDGRDVEWVANEKYAWC